MNQFKYFCILIFCTLCCSSTFSQTTLSIKSSDTTIKLPDISLGASEKHQRKRIALPEKLHLTPAATAKPVEVKTTGDKFTWVLPKKYCTLSDTYGTRGGKHYGIDAPANAGTPIFACKSGRITKAGWKKLEGNYVCLETKVKGSVYEVTTCHASRNLVKKGDTVREGQTVQIVGSTGRSSGNHTHVGARKDGKRVNPALLPWDVKLLVSKKYKKRRR